MTALHTQTFVRLAKEHVASHPNEFVSPFAMPRSKGTKKGKSSSKSKGKRKGKGKGKSKEPSSSTSPLKQRIDVLINFIKGHLMLVIGEKCFVYKDVIETAGSWKLPAIVKHICHRQIDFLDDDNSLGDLENLIWKTDPTHFQLIKTQLDANLRDGTGRLFTFFLTAFMTMLNKELNVKCPPNDESEDAGYIINRCIFSKKSFQLLCENLSSAIQPLSATSLNCRWIHLTCRLCLNRVMSYLFDPRMSPFQIVTDLITATKKCAVILLNSRRTEDFMAGNPAKAQSIVGDLCRKVFAPPTNITPRINIVKAPRLSENPSGKEFDASNILLSFAPTTLHAVLTFERRWMYCSPFSLATDVLSDKRATNTSHTFLCTIQQFSLIYGLLRNLRRR